MRADFVDPGPVLARVPNARRAPFPLMPAVGNMYLALLVGIVPTMALLLVTGLALRSTKLTLAAVGIGVLGFLAPLLPIGVGVALSDTPNVAFILFVGRVLSVGLGFVAYKVALPSIRGHAHLEGAQLPLLYVLGPAFGLLFLLPGEVVLALVAPILLVLGG